MIWDKEKEKEVLDRRIAGGTYKAIAEAMGATPTGVKHKVRRLLQATNNDKYKHTKEKTEIAERFIFGDNLSILETHCGFGGMTEVYSNYGNVECYDIDKKRVKHIDEMGFECVQAIKGDSEKEIIRLLNYKCKYDVVDIDPYGMPSRYFPYVFGLIDDGLLFVTLPMIGVAQMNKITIRHLDAFWGVDYRDKEAYLDKVTARMSDYAFQHKREMKVLEIVRIDRVFRLVIKVRKKSLCDIVGLKVNRAT